MYEFNFSDAAHNGFAPEKLPSNEIVLVGSVTFAEPTPIALLVSIFSSPDSSQA
jgi:hypothetical protein